MPGVKKGNTIYSGVKTDKILYIVVFCEGTLG